MAIRINRAKNFAGKSYVISTEVDNLIKSFNLAGNVLQFTTADGATANTSAIDLTPIRTSAALDAVDTVTGNALTTGNIVAAKTASSVETTDYAIGVTTSANFGSANKLATEAGVKDYVDNKAINVVAGTGVSIDNSNVLQPVINTNIKLVKKETANGDAAASYQLMYLSGEDTYSVLNSSVDIDIPKDQFLKSAEFGWATAGDGTGWVAPASKTAETTVPVIKFVVFTTTVTSGIANTADKELFVDCTSFYREYEEGNRIEIVNGNQIGVKVGNGIDATVTSAVVVKADASDTIYTTKGNATSVMSVTSNGVKATGIQAAIDLAVNDEHAKMSAAVAAVDANASAVNAQLAVTASAVVSNVNSAVTSTVTTVVSAVNAAVTSTVADVNSKVSAVVTKAVELVETSVALTAGTTSGITVAIENGVVSVSGIAGNVLAVFDADGVQIQPEITKTGSGTAATNVLTADYGTASVDASWTVLHTKAISYTNATAVDATATATAVTDVASAAYTNATVGALDYKQAAE